MASHRPILQGHARRAAWALAIGVVGVAARAEAGQVSGLASTRATAPTAFAAFAALPVLPVLLLAAVAFLAAAAIWIRVLLRAVHARTDDALEKNAQLEQAAQALVAEQAQLRSLFEGSPDALALKDRNRVYVHCNRGFEALLDLPRHRIVGHTDAQLFSDKHFVAAIAAKDQDVLARGMPHRSEVMLTATDGREHCLEVIKVPIRGADGDVTGLLAASRDITERRHAERELRIAAVAFESQDGMLITDSAGIIERVNAAFTRISGYGEADAVGQSPRLLQSGLHEPGFYRQMWAALTRAGYWNGEVANRHKHGRLYTVRLSITAVADAQGATIHYVGNFQDISAEKEARALADRLRLFDQLTDLPNRVLLAQHMDRAVTGRAATHDFGAVMMLNLDHFQKINDSLGHGVGDRLLVEITRRLAAVKRDGDTMARFSGDSFVLLCESLGQDKHLAVTRAMAIAEGLRVAMADPAILEDQEFSCSGSIGVTLFHDSRTDAGTLLRQAELAMYKSKKGGRDRVSFFEDGMQSELDDCNRLEGELREAIRKEQLVLFYQVQVDGDGRPTGAEALVRWNHPRRGLIPPSAFIPLAEETGLIVPLGRWAIACACRQLARWEAHPDLEALTLAVNISPLQFKADSFVDDILDEVRRTGAPVARLKLEVTESLAIDDFTGSISKLNTLKALGFSISLDDFGTGNSSLNYLTKLPLTQLKIDKSFVDELPASARDAMVTQTIIAMGRGLGLEVIAEGVETPAQRDFLLAHHCHVFQGYLFGKPMPVDEFEAAVRAKAAERLGASMPACR